MARPLTRPASRVFIPVPARGARALKDFIAKGSVRDWNTAAANAVVMAATDVTAILALHNMPTGVLCHVCAYAGAQGVRLPWKEVQRYSHVCGSPTGAMRSPLLVAALLRLLEWGGATSAAAVMAWMFSYLAEVTWDGRSAQPYGPLQLLVTMAADGDCGAGAAAAMLRALLQHVWLVGESPERDDAFATAAATLLDGPASPPLPVPEVVADGAAMHLPYVSMLRLAAATGATPTPHLLVGGSDATVKERTAAFRAAMHDGAWARRRAAVAAMAARQAHVAAAAAAAGIRLQYKINSTAGDAARAARAALRAAATDGARDAVAAPAAPTSAAASAALAASAASPP